MSITAFIEVEVEIEFTIHPGEAATADCDGSDEICEITAITLNDPMFKGNAFIVPYEYPGNMPKIADKLEKLMNELEERCLTDYDNH